MELTTNINTIFQENIWKKYHFFYSQYIECEFLLYGLY